MARRRFNWNAYHDIVPDGVTNTDGKLIHMEQAILYTLMEEDFPESYDVSDFIMTTVRARYVGNYPYTGVLDVPNREESLYKMWFKFQPNDAENNVIWQDIEYAEICVDPLTYEVTQILYRLHTAEELKYTYDDLDDLETKLQEYFGYQYDRKLRGIE
jgi:hypothetical protein